MPKGDGVKNESMEVRVQRMRGLQLSEEDLLKYTTPAPDPNKIHALLSGAGGRPPCFDSPEDMVDGIEDYFASCMQPTFDKDGVQTGVRWIRKPTVGGLAIHLGVSRDTIWRYSKSDQFSDLIKRAKDIIANFTEEMLMEGRNPAGAINTLVNLHIGWVADEKTIKLEPVVPNNQAKTPEEIAAFLDERALPEPEEG